MSHRLLNEKFLPEKVGVVLVVRNRAPAATDRRHPIGTMWLDTAGSTLYALEDPKTGSWITASTVDLSNPPAIGNVTPNTGEFTTLASDSYETTDAADGLTIASNGITADGTNADINIDVVPKGVGILDVAGGVEATSYATDDAADGLTMSSNDIVADGTNANIDINLTPKGTGAVVIPVVDINGGTIDGVTLTTTDVTADNFYTSDLVTGLTITSNGISADGTDLSIDVNVTPKGAGILACGGYVEAPGFVTTDAADGLTITSNGIAADGTNVDISINATPKGAGLFDVAGGVEATSYATDDAADGLTITSNSISADGTNVDIDIDLTPKGAGEVNIPLVDIDGGTLDDVDVNANALTLDNISVGYANSEWEFKQAGVQTLNAVSTPIAGITLPVNSMVSIEARINGIRSDYAEAIAATVFYSARRVGAGAVQITAPIRNIMEDSAGAPSVSADVSGNDARILVQGLAGQTWNWVVSYSYHLTQTNL